MNPPLSACVDVRTARLPSDCVLLPVREGRLVVSRRHATYCLIPESQVLSVQAVLGGQPLATLDEALLWDLHRHGFFGSPRPWRDVRPNAQLHLTNRCQLRCGYCSMHAGPAIPNELPRRRWFALLDEITTHMPEAQVSLLGGEIFLLPWAIDLAEEVQRRGRPLVIFTNGLPLASNARLAQRVGGLAAAGAKILFSLPGASADVCDRISGGPRFEAALTALHAVAAAGPPPDLQIVLMPSNVDDVATNLHGLRRRLPEGTPLTFSFLGQRGRERGLNLFPSRAAVEAALDRIAFEAGERVPASRPSPLSERRDGCACALGVHINVRADGAVFGCFQMEELQGQLRPGELPSLLAGLAAAAQPADRLPLCADCALASLCGAGCRAENVALTGDARTPACGPWRVRVLCELLAQDRPDALRWPARHLLAEAHALKLDAPAELLRRVESPVTLRADGRIRPGP